MKRYKVTCNGIDLVIKGNPVHEFGSKLLYDIEVYLGEPDCDILEIIDEDILNEIITQALEKEKLDDTRRI